MDRQRWLVVLVIVFLATATFVGFDLIKNKRWQRITGNQSNWNWSDNWGNPPLVPFPQQPQNPPTHGPSIVARTYLEAIQMSAKTGRPVLAFFESANCKWCKKMKAEVLPSPIVQSMLSNYIFVSISTDLDKAVASRFGIQYVPAYVITNQSQQNLKSGSKFLGVEEFSQWLNNSGLYSKPSAGFAGR